MKPFKEVIDGIRKAVMASEVREDLAQMGEYVEQFANTAGENIQKAIDPTLSLSGKAADAAKVGEAVGQVKEDVDVQNEIIRVQNKTIIGYPYVIMRIGGYESDGKTPTTNKTRISAANYIEIEKCVSIKPVVNIGMYWFAYDQNKKLLGTIDKWRTGTSAYKISSIVSKYPSAVFFRIVFRKIDLSDFTVDEVYNYVIFNWIDDTSKTINQRLLELEKNDYNLLSYDSVHKCDKSVVSPVPVPFRMLYDYNSGSLQDMVMDDSYFYMAFAGGNLRKIARDSFQLVETITSDLYNHVINMYFLPNGNMFVASKKDDTTSIFVEVSSADYTTIVAQYDLPMEIDDKIPMCAMKRDDNTIIAFYGTTGTTYPKHIEVYQYIIESKTISKESELSLDTRYGQGCTVIGNIAYIMFNKGYLAGNAPSDSFILCYNMRNFKEVGTVYLDNFGETEGVSFESKSKNTYMYFCENGTHVLYEALIN